jgi:hypothetical protein
MNVRVDQDTILVRFKDYGFFVPVGIQDKLVMVEGLLNVKRETVSQIKHFLEDEGASRKKINAVKGPKSIYHFLATGVETI